MNHSFVHPLFILGVGIGLGSAASTSLRVEFAQATPQTIPSFNPSQSLAPLVETLSGSVVNITVSMDQQPIHPMAPFGWDMETPIPSGQGSGFLISNDGYILTNYHVIDGADTLTVKLANEEEYTGSVVGFDDSIDVALIKIESDSTLPYIKLGNSDAVRVGDYAVAIGNPFGLSHTVTMGIISAKERVIGSGPYDNYLQTDASINPGNSGGPLFNLQGEAIGINTAINPRAQGIGFSLPINKVTSILDDLKENGRPSRGWLGLGLQPFESDGQDGAMVREVYPNTPADKAGLESGDIITTFDNKSVTSIDEFIRMVGSYRSGDTVPIEIIRGRKPKQLSVTLGERPSQQALSAGKFIQEGTDTWGIQTAQTQSFNGDNSSQGLVVIQLEKTSPLKDILQLGDIILLINDTPVQQSSLAQLSTKAPATFTVWRQGKTIKLQYKQ
mgnify:CR=1 FL=1